MTYIINPMWFYWVQLINNIQSLFIIVSCLLCALVLVMLIILLANTGFVDYDDVETKQLKKWITRCGILCIIFGVMAAVIPSKNVLIEMQIAKCATTENAEWTLEAIKSAVDYIVEAIKSIK